MVRTTYPSGAESVKVAAADTAVRDLDIDVGLLPRLGLKLAPLHLALGRAGIEAKPSFKLVVGHF